MLKIIENVTGNIAAKLYLMRFETLANLISKISWAVYDKCPTGYKGKL